MNKDELAKVLKTKFEENDEWETQTEMADEIGLSSASLSCYMRGKRFPSKKMLKKIKKVVDVSKTQKQLNLTENKEEEKSMESKVIEELDEKFRKLIQTNEPIKDPVHGYVELTTLEKNIIDCESFQRLRNITQLGPTSLVYPGAIHNRFLHSIGTLHVAHNLINKINNKADTYNKLENQIERFEDGKIENSDELAKKIGYEEIFLTRIYALIHDLAHVPYGHTLEDEGNLFPSEWKDLNRLKKYFDQDISEIIKDRMENYNFPESKIEKTINELRRLLTCRIDKEKEKEKFDRFKDDYGIEPAEKPMDLKYPYVYDLISNTLCADLIDYSQRDMFFSGLPERWGDYFLRYLSIVPKEIKDNGEYKPRVVLQAFRYEEDQEDKVKKLDRRRNVFSEAIDILRKRYSLAEKVYFHRTKIAASAMLISAVNEMIEDDKLELDELYDLGEKQLVKKISEEGTDRAKKIIKNYNNRDLYTPIYEINHAETSEWSEKYQKITNLTRDFRESSHRLKENHKIEKMMEDIFGEDFKGDIVIYCPDPEMNFKDFEMLVQKEPKGEIKKLSDFAEHTREKEMEAMEELYRKLWRFSVFVNPDKIPLDEDDKPKVRVLIKILYDKFGLRNEKEKFRDKLDPFEAQLECIMEEEGIMDEISVSQFKTELQEIETSQESKVPKREKVKKTMLEMVKED